MNRALNNTSARLNSINDNKFQIPSELNFNIFSSREAYSRGLGEILLPETPLTGHHSNFN